MKTIDEKWFERKSPISIASIILLLSTIALGFIIRFLGLLNYNIFDIGPAPDQVRDSFVIMGMWEGKFPTLGPSASVGGYSLLPLYYYLVFPFAIFGADPRWQVLPNTLLSFLSIPLFIYLIYQLLIKVETKQRLFLSLLAGFWYSTIFPEIFINTFQWNPGPIPFFLFSFILIYQYLYRSTEQISFKKAMIFWSLYGIILAFLMSLHSTTMFVMPLVFVATVAIFIFKNRFDRIQLLFPAVAVFSSFLVLTPYWKGELSQGFENTRQIIKTVLGANKVANAGNSISERLSNLLWNYLDLGQQAYFLNKSTAIFWLSVIFLISIVILSAIYRKYDRLIATMLGFTWIIYLYAASNFQGTFFLHYKFLFYFAPIVLTIASLAYLNYNDRIQKAIGIILVVIIAFSCLSNLHQDFRYLASKYSPEKLMSTTDYVSVLNTIPDRSTLCDPSYQKMRLKINPYTYLDKYITKKNIAVTNECKAGNYRVYPKYKLKQAIDKYWPAFTIIENPEWSSLAKAKNISKAEHFAIEQS